MNCNIERSSTITCFGAMNLFINLSQVYVNMVVSDMYFLDFTYSGTL